MYNILQMDNIYSDDEPPVIEPRENVPIFNVNNNDYDKTDIQEITASFEENEHCTKKSKSRLQEAKITTCNSKNSELDIDLESTRLDNLEDSIISAPVAKPTPFFPIFNVQNNNTKKSKSPRFQKTEISTYNSKRRRGGMFEKSKNIHNSEGGNENQTNKNNTTISDRCLICYQYLKNPNILLYKGHPKDAIEEEIALTDPKLLLFTGEEDEINQLDKLPVNKITNFSVYDKKGHLCPFDTGLVEKDVMLYFSGYMKPIYDEDPSPENGIPVKDVGPINAWWISGFDGGKDVLGGVSTAYGEYYLMQPSKEYKPVMKPIEEKLYLSKTVIEYLIKIEIGRAHV